MFKKFIIGAVAGAALLGFTGMAQAANYVLNIYGASAQYLYWNDAADDFLRSVKGCTVVAQGQRTETDNSKKHGMTTGSSCTGGHTYTIRYSSKASYDGILALQGDNNQAGGSDKCIATELDMDTNAQIGSSFGYYRKMKRTATNTDTTESLGCAKINLGASDVAGSSFTQESHGCAKGPLTTGAPNCTGTNWINRSFTGISTAGLTSAQPLVVPFGFFANNGVTHTVCLSPDPETPSSLADKAVSAWGNQCWDKNDGGVCTNNLCVGGPYPGQSCTTNVNCNLPTEDGHSADCIGYYKCINRLCSGGVNVGNACDEVVDCPDVTVANTTCTRVPLDNISRLMATQIFSGQALYWTDFGAYYNADAITACMRHAGSGTQATFAIMMAGNGWGTGLPINQNAAGPYIWFNDGSGDMMACINSAAGAIGYADCDQLVGSKASGTAIFPYEQVHAMKLDGIECRRPKIRNGEYPFYSGNWNFWRTGDPDAAVIGDLIAFASNPNNIPANKKDYWATVGEMVFNKTSDAAWPGYVGASNPQLP